MREQGDVSGPLYVLKRLKNRNRLDRFAREVTTALSLDHPNILKVVDQDLEQERPYFVAEYCAGGPLDDADLSQYGFVDKLRIFRAICRAVGYAHAQGVIHRDIKPANIFLRAEEHTPVVGDFGICFLTEEGERITLVDEAVGPRLFMAPELEDGRLEDISPASDVYSLGKLLYWIMSGKVFSRERHREKAYNLANLLGGTAPYFINEVLDQTIVADPRRRLTDASELAEATDMVVRRIVMNAHVIGQNIEQACNYCGVGFYKTVVSSTIRGEYPNISIDDTAMHNAGFARGGAGSQDWRILVCNYCGNVQRFRQDLADNPKIWKEPR